MYKIEKRHYGVRLTFEGFIERDEMAQWVAESEMVLQTLPKKFSVFVDMRNLKPVPDDSKAELEKGQRMYKAKGMERSVVILNSAILRIQFKNIAQETGIYEWERYIDASNTPNWQEVGEKWIMNAIDPDL